MNTRTRTKYLSADMITEAIGLYIYQLKGTVVKNDDIKMLVVDGKVIGAKISVNWWKESELT